MKQNYCLPIIKTTKKEVGEVIMLHEGDYAYLEVWLDYIADCDVAFVASLTKKLGERLIIVFRRQKLEKPLMEQSLRESFIRSLHNTNVKVDFDIETQQDDLRFIQTEQLKVNLITSYHNYEHTPDISQLEKILEKMVRFQPRIYKVAAFCKNEKDAHTLLGILLSLKSQNKSCIILGMGKYGFITRIFGTLWGNEMIFAPLTTREESAPGQLTKVQLETIFTILKQ